MQKHEADRWWLIGKGVEITVDNSKIDWSGLEFPPNTKIGADFQIQTHDAFIDLPWETSSTYGGTSFTRITQTHAIVHDQTYHYNYRPNTNGKDIIRNIMTWYGAPRLPWPNNAKGMRGMDFNIKYRNRLFRLK